MPISGALVSKLLGLPSHYAAGLVLLACCPGGTASNLITYLARGNVALSVLMTTASTFLAVIMTPFLTAKLAGQYFTVDAVGLFASTLQYVVLFPVLTGAIMNQYIPRIVSKLSPFTPLIAVLSVSALCASAIAQNASAILSSGGQVIIAVGALHAAGYFFGFLLSKVFGFDSSTSRTISIEVGMQACLYELLESCHNLYELRMIFFVLGSSKCFSFLCSLFSAAIIVFPHLVLQNSVLGVVLAGQHFSNPLTAVPCAVSSVLQSIFGRALAGLWRLSSGNEVQS